MTLVPIDAIDKTLVGLPRLMAAVEALPATAKITVMTHGFKYAPGQAGRCPHDHILSFAPDGLNPRVISWPMGLGVGADHLGIAFGWDGSGSLWRAWQMSAEAGRLLGHLVDLLAARGRRVDIIAHSLGARVALTAMASAGAGSVGKAILIAPAEFQARAQAALGGPAGKTAQVLNVISRENALYDRGLEWLIAPHRWGERSLGLGLAEDHARWTDLQIDQPATRQVLGDLGYRVAAPTQRICHWSGYVREGLFPLYRDILADRLPLTLLGRALAPVARPGFRPAMAQAFDLLPLGRGLSP
jgi:Alpha/beta hydrolase family